MIVKLIIDYIFSAIAGIGFGIVFNPPFKVLLLSGLFAGAGHSLRLLLMEQYSVNIFVATLICACFIGILGFFMGRIDGCPSEIFTFPAVLPMIPGIYAYETFLSVIKFLFEAVGSSMREEYLMAVMSNGIIASSILVAIVLGASASVFLDTLSNRIKKRKLRIRLKGRYRKIIN